MGSKKPAERRFMLEDCQREEVAPYLSVQELIDDSKREWKSTMVKALFSKDVTRQILSIPLRHQNVNVVAY